MGLLDQFNANDPQTMGLLSAAAGMFNASGPSLMPHSFGQVLGAGLQGLGSGLEDATKRQREAMQMQMLQQQVAQATRKNELINSFLAANMGGGQGQAPDAGAGQGQMPGSGGAPAAGTGGMPAGPSMSPAGSAPGFGGVPSSAIAADLAFNNGGKMGEWINDRSKPTDFAKLLVQSGIDPNTPLGRQLMQAQVAKQNHVAPVNARPGSIMRDPFDPSKVVAFNPHIPEGGMPKFDAGGNVTGINALPGAADVTQSMARAGAAGKASVEPITGYNGTQPVFTNKLAAATGGTWTGGALPAAQLARLQQAAQGGSQDARDMLDAYSKAQGGGQLTPGLAPGMAESQSALATSGAKRYTDTLDLAAESPTRVNVYDNILNLSKEGVTSGPGEAWKNKVKGYVANAPLLGTVSGGWKDDVSGFQELKKFMYQNAQRNWQAAGGTGTNAQLDAFSDSNPNDTMFPQALQKMAEWGKAGELALQGKANAMQQWKDANGGNVAQQDQFERTWRNNFDPVLFQLKTMDPQQAAAFVQNLKTKNPNAYSTLMLKAKALQNAGGL